MSASPAINHSMLLTTAHGSNSKWFRLQKSSPVFHIHKVQLSFCVRMMLESPLIADSSELQSTDSDCISLQGVMSKLNVSSVLVQLWIRLHSSFQCIGFTEIATGISENVPCKKEKNSSKDGAHYQKKRTQSVVQSVLHAFSNSSNWYFIHF